MTVKTNVERKMNYLVGDFWAITKLGSESVLDNPLDGGTGVGSSS